MPTSTWNRDPPLGFRGLHPDVPITFYHRQLPHWRQDGATYFVTFRLADSLPQAKLRELESVKREFAARHGIRGPRWQSILRTQCRSLPRREWEALSRKLMQRIEAWLDQGIGECVLRQKENMETVAEALQHFDNTLYQLGSFVVMPNYVHLVIQPIDCKSTPLEKILQGRKRRMSREINARLDRGGPLWHEESFDRIIRDEEHLYRCIQYIGDNPRRAGLADGEWLRWIRPEWEAAGWGFEWHP